LTFQTGASAGVLSAEQPGVYALDVTDPARPKILWEQLTPASPAAVDLGVGIGLAMAPVKTATELTHYTFVQTNNGGSGGAGTFVAAYVTETGAQAWSWTRAYPAPRSVLSLPLPTTGVPGGVAALDKLGQGRATHVLVPTLYGEVYMVDAATGANTLGSEALFRFSSDYHPIGAPPTIYRDGGGALHAIAVSGGYADPLATTWAPAIVNQYAVAFDLDPVIGSLPVTESEGIGDRRFTIDLGVGNKAYSQAVIDGNELYIATDFDDANLPTFGLLAGTGQLKRVNLGTGSVVSTTAIASGAAGVDSADGKVWTASAGGSVDYSSDFDPGTGNMATELVTPPTAKRKLWLRIE
jgi:hypothetical protein